MAFLEKIVGKKEELDIEEYLNNIDVEEESLYEDADAYVKPISLNSEVEKDLVLEEAKAGNIIILNIADLSKRNSIKLRELITDIKTGISGIDGDMARLSNDRVLITPSRVKIVKRKEPA
ncbi:MAG: cell division protein SepF [Candidatus Diapherotrites archaeon]|nr:cell division protein SepF [Candidatus Diapherotrites archaeon]